MKRSWHPHEAALDLLESRAGPFESSSFRSALLSYRPDWSDSTFGAVNADGTLAAIAALSRRGVVQSMPYGYGALHCSREIDRSMLNTFLDAARRQAGGRELQLRLLVGAGEHLDGSTTRLPPTSLVLVDPAVEPEAHYSQNARQYLRKLDAAGAVVEETADVRAFLTLYRECADRYAMRYPERLLLCLGASGSARSFTVSIDGEVLAAALALVAQDHWMYWLAAQSAAGRQHRAGYLALASLIRAARREGARGVNLGSSWSSGPLPGVAAFKEKFRPTPHQLLEVGSASPIGKLTGSARTVIRRIGDPVAHRYRARVRK